MAARKKLKQIPKFTSEDAEQDFWATHDTTEYFDAENMLGAEDAPSPNLKPSLVSVTVRMPAALIDALKAHANAIGIPYQSLMKVWLHERLTSGSGGVLDRTG